MSTEMDREPLTEGVVSTTAGTADALLNIANLSSMAQRAQHAVARAIRDEAYERGVAEGRRQAAEEANAFRRGIRALIEQEHHEVGILEGCTACTRWAVRVARGEIAREDVTGRCELGQQLQQDINAALELIMAGPCHEKGSTDA
jgi:cation transport ATPase